MMPYFGLACVVLLYISIGFEWIQHTDCAERVLQQKRKELFVSEMAIVWHKQTWPKKTISSPTQP